MILEAVICLAMNMYHEARGEGEEAMMAVAEVTLNRVKSHKYPNTVCEVVKQGYTDRKGSMILNKCQFSWYCDGKSDKMRNEDMRNLAEELAIDYLTGLETNLTKGATHYHAVYVKPRWRKSFSKTTKIGSHIFYK